MNEVGCQVKTADPELASLAAEKRQTSLPHIHPSKILITISVTSHENKKKNQFFSR